MSRPKQSPKTSARRWQHCHPGHVDYWLNISPDDQWLVLDTERFDAECDGWGCLVILPADLSSGEVVVRAAGVVVHPQGFSSVASGGNLIVFSETGGPHEQDLWAAIRNDGEWNASVLLTADSPMHMPTCRPYRTMEARYCSTARTNPIAHFSQFAPRISAPTRVGVRR